jgi:DNA-binding NarL/FixJ family response regulator
MPSASQPTRDDEPISVVVADYSYVVRAGLASTLGSAPEIDVVGVCSDGNELSAAIESMRPRVVITDLRMPPSGEREGLIIAARLRETDPEVGVIVLTHYLESAHAIALMEGGTSRRGYLLKDRIHNRAELLEAIRAVATGGSVLDPTVVDALIEGRVRGSASPLDELTPRERQILAEIAEGKSNAAIATSLFLTKHAVEKHVNSVFAKLDLPGPESVSRRVKATLLYLADVSGRPDVHG